MLESLFLLLLGGVGLYYGSDYLVKGVSSFSLRVGLPSYIVGMVVVGFGTSAPELFVSIMAALEGNADITLGNVIGSNIANLGLVLAACALYKPMMIPWKADRFDAFIMVTLSILFSIFLYFGDFNRGIGLFFILGLVTYMTWLIIHGRKQLEEMHHKPEEVNLDLNPSSATDVIEMVGGLIGLLIGAHFFFTGSVELATMLGVSDAVIGLTVVALGTSLPELAASLMAVNRNKGDIALGNIVGSCIYNILGIIGFTALINPYKVSDIVAWDYIVMTLLAIIVVIMMRTTKKLHRWEGAFLLLCYLGYMLTLALCTRERGQILCI